jgi:hypothetical protein
MSSPPSTILPLRENTSSSSMDHSKDAATITTSPSTDHPPHSETVGLMGSADSSAPPPLPRIASAPMLPRKRKSTKQRAHTHPGETFFGKVALPFHPTAQPKEKLPGAVVPPLEGLFKGLLDAPRRVGDAPSVLQQLWNVTTYSWLNLLLLFIPISWAVVSAFPLILPGTALRRAGGAVSTACPTHQEPTLLHTLGTSLVHAGPLPPSRVAFSRLETTTQPPLWPHCSTDSLLTRASIISYVIALRPPKFDHRLRLLLYRHHSTGCAPRICNGRNCNPRGTRDRRFAQRDIRKCCRGWSIPLSNRSV